MKKGFTMIELIFVIVILGILASVAIPRLYGTKNEAAVAAATADLRTLFADLTSYYLVNGQLDFGSDNGKKMTSVPLTSCSSAASGGAITTCTISYENKTCFTIQSKGNKIWFPIADTTTNLPSKKGNCGAVLNDRNLRSTYFTKYTDENNAFTVGAKLLN